MELDVLVSSIVIALLILFPLAIKWRIKIKHALLGVLLFGGTTGTILSWDWLRGDINFLLLLFVELFLIAELTIVTIAFFFYRDPERIPPKRGGIILSPADGEVVYVNKVSREQPIFSEKNGRKIELKDLMGDDLCPKEAYLVGIAMNLLNVHVNRAPVDGKVTLLKHVKGTFTSLKSREAILQNERFITIIENGQLKMGVIQIASRLVRRIVSYLKEGELVQIGQRIGMIKFGSQVDLLIPKSCDLKIEVEPGDEVIAGVSIIAVYEQ